MNERLAAELESLRIDRGTTRRTSPPVGRTLRVLAVVGALALGSVVAWRVGIPWIEARVFKTEVATTEILVVSPVQGQIQLTSTGYVVPQVEADVSSKVVGRIERTNVTEGDRVRVGQVLFELDARDERVGVASAAARVTAARARAAEARAQLTEIVVQRDRERRLVETGASASATADDLATKAASLERHVRSGDADVQTAEAELNERQTTLARMTIRAPIDGTVVTKPRQPGEVVTPGVALLTLSDFSSIVVEADVAEARLHAVRRGGPCEIVLDAYPDRRWRGEVTEVSPKLNRAKASATVKVRFLERDDTVLPEMAARISFLESPLDPAKLADPPKTIVPESALAERAGTKVVFVVDAGRARAVPVSLGKSFAGGFELIAGPAPGTKVVSAPPATLEDGQSIRERNPG
ncbi:MAG: efflux RND transporter periplasmic adaptor subunit [Polyangiaceae bacterium]|jgi:RND family efflux transporter MFP subunit